MAFSSGVQQWTLKVPAGSLQEWNLTFTTTDPGGTTPYPISGSWEYVVRPSATDTGAPTFTITTSASAAGQLVVTSTAALSQVQLQIAPAATAALTPGNYAHALWMRPATTAAFCWLSGEFLLIGNPQP